jgi:hypothetical protein
MSYLDIPRIHLAGRFFTDPSTVNNDPTHYNPDCAVPSPWQEPDGQHRFQLRDCTIRSAVDTNGFVNNDAVIGASFESTDIPDPARIVDLDVYQQGVPTIIGMQISITLPNGQSILGNMDPAVLNGLWFNSVLPTRSWEDSDYVQDSFGGDMNAAGYFHTVVRFNIANWPPVSSLILTQLRGATITVNGQLLLSFRFVLDGYENVPQDSNFRTGRIVGTLGPVFANEPLYNAGQRWMQPRSFSTNDPWNWPSFNECCFKVDKIRNKLVLDLANSLCRQKAGGPPVDLGELTAQIGFLDPPVINIGTVDYSEFSYENNAHITELPLTATQIQILDEQGLNLVISRTDLGAPLILSEVADVPVYAVEVRPIRMTGNPGTTATTQVYVSLNGVPVSGKQLNLHIESVHGNTPGATVPPTNPGDTPQADGALTATITPTNQYGFATVTLNVVKDPGYRTTELDGQLYFVTVYDPLLPEPNWKTDAPVQEHLISVLVWSNYTVNQNPGWEDVVSIFAPYMKLYPFMKKQLDLTDPHSFRIFATNPPWIAYNPQNPPPPYKFPGNSNLQIDAGAIAYYLTFDFNDPRYMPITRDLSPNKILTVLYYIKNLQATPPPPGTITT